MASEQKQGRVGIVGLGRWAKVLTKASKQSTKIEGCWDCKNTNT
jgi:hypothetical protein